MNLDDFVDEAYEGETLLKMDGMDGACLGVVEIAGQNPVLVYDREACVRILVEEQGMEEDEAEEYFEVNAATAYVGPGTPGILHRIPVE